jgi:DNA-binding CsgD family transcriptional regulator
MPRLSRAQQLARQQIARLAGGGESSGQVGERLLAAIALAVGSDVAQVAAIDPTSLLFNRLLAANNGAQIHLHWYLRNLYLNEPVSDYTHPGMMRAGLTAVVLHDRPETSWGLPRHLAELVPASAWSRAYYERTGAAGGTLRAFFAAEGQWIGALDLTRFDAGTPFRPTDVDFLRLVAPMVGRALRGALDRERAQRPAAGADDDTCGVLALAPDGRVQWATPAAESWLNVLQDAGLSAERQLPSVIWAVVAGVRAGEERRGLASIAVPTPRGVLRIQASPASADGTVAVVLAPQFQPKPPAIPARWGLTPQERNVVEQVVRGLSNRQVARALVITEDTVEAHLRRIYAKLDVRNRSRLIARYFAETYDLD